ncbi:SANT and BTB domain regulator of class switch recombination isoform X2 [Tachypleus tridentatus]|uniref:SANT and BTB domain regulator of class switch recombination isoform X2 n=1 Tax=Tachypleus tridentatus TaxID=6853 RepID=UPI003FD4A9DF
MDGQLCDSPYTYLVLKTLSEVSRSNGSNINSISTYLKWNWKRIAQLSGRKNPEILKREYEKLNPPQKSSEPSSSKHVFWNASVPNISNSTKVSTKAEKKSQSCVFGKSSECVVDKSGDENPVRSSANIQRSVSSCDLHWILVQICVKDDTNNRQETFSCSRDLILSHMPYFRQFISEEDHSTEVEISVHCDLEVFRRLIAFVKNHETGYKDIEIEPRYAIHLLVSADFLQMEWLVQQCLQFCYENMNVILATSSPVSAIGDQLTQRLAGLFSYKDLEQLEDPKDRIKSRLYKKHIDYLLKPEMSSSRCKGTIGGVHSLVRCVSCEKVFVPKLQTAISCLSSRAFIDNKGEISYAHKRDQNWDKDSYIQMLFKELGLWGQVFWRIWGLVRCLTCSRCGKDFPCSDLYRCCYHPEAAKYPEQLHNRSRQGFYPCCGRRALKYNPLDPLGTFLGCTYSEHSVTQDCKQTEIYQELVKHKDLVCLPQLESHVSVDNNSEALLLSTIKTVAVSQSHAGSLGSTTKVCSVFGGPGKWSPTVTISRHLKAVVVEENREKEFSQSQEVSSPSTVYRFQQTSANQLWNPTNSLWHNQDSVREYDHSNFDSLIAHLKRLRIERC